MSFASLPYELRRAILDDAGIWPSMLAGLCLVSKDMLEVARPRLYRRLRFTVTNSAEHYREMEEERQALQANWHDDPDWRDDDEADIEYREQEFLYDRRQLRCLLRTLDDRPDLARHLDHVVIGAQGPYDVLGFERTIKVLSRWDNFRHVTLHGLELDASAGAALCGVLPLGLRSLELETTVDASDLCRMLAKVPQLETLEVDWVRPDLNHSNVHVRLPRLRVLVLHSCIGIEGLLRTVTSALPPLTKLTLSIDGFPWLVPQCLARVTSLHFSVDPEDDALELGIRSVKALCRALDSAPLLREFGVAGLDMFYLHDEPRWSVIAFARYDVLSHVCRSVSRLVLNDAFFSSEQVERFVRGRDTTARLEVEWVKSATWVIPGSESATRERRKDFDKLCQERNVRIDWNDWRDDVGTDEQEGQD